MTDNPRQQRKNQKSSKSSINRYAAIGLIVLAVGFGIYLTSGSQPDEPGEQTSHTPTEQSLGRLYSEAKGDLESKKLKQAAGKFKQIANIKPGYKDAAEQGAAIAQTFYETGVEQMEDGETEEAAESFNVAAAIDPGNEEIEDAVIEVAGQGGNGSNAGDSNAGDSNAGGSDDELKPIPEDATALSLHLTEIENYLSIKKAWNSEPINASSVYLPVGQEMRTEVDRVIVSISNYKTTKLAEEALKMAEDAHPMENEDVSVNDHNAYSGLNNFSGSEMFALKQIATLSWTRDNWFFSIRVLPTSEGTPSNEFKKGVARDIAAALGY